jgi:HSP20 family protein
MNGFNLIRREPTLPYFPRFDSTFFREMEDMSDRLTKMFGMGTRPFDLKENVKLVDWTPAVDIEETDKEYLFKLELPELRKEDVQVTVEENVLTISGERKFDKEEKGKKFHRIERAYGTFLRTFAVPPEADPTKVTAEFKEGVLFVHLFKAERPHPKALQVKIV